MDLPRQRTILHNNSNWFLCHINPYMWLTKWGAFFKTPHRMISRGDPSASGKNPCVRHHGRRQGLKFYKHPGFLHRYPMDSPVVVLAMMANPSIDGKVVVTVM